MMMKPFLIIDIGLMVPGERKADRRENGSMRSVTAATGECTGSGAGV